jgi:hypothetical protein
MDSAQMEMAPVAPVFGSLIDRFDWPVAFVLTGSATALLAIAWLVFVTDRPKEIQEALLSLIERSDRWWEIRAGTIAQTHTVQEVSSALREYVVSRPQEVWPEAVPPNLEPGIYRPVVQEMLQRSPTFRRQCWRITTASDLVVTLQPGSRPMVTRVRARTRISRDGHRLVANIEIFSPDQAAELIAHELEHVIEQLDGVDLASKADAAMSGVRRGEAPEPSFETVRATRAGMTVAAEVRRGLD